ncbi:MAG: rhodanese-like domain-containing protein [Sulfuriferula sp.]|nr:rhodanese-like domain-containing protein [Sulfuriferula sp.]
MKDMSPQELAKFIAQHPNAVIVDVRFEHERQDCGYINQSHHIPILNAEWDVNPQFVDEVSKLAAQDVPVVFICRSGNRSYVACELLMAQGYKRVYNLQGGYVALSHTLTHAKDTNQATLLHLPA